MLAKPKIKTVPTFEKNGFLQEEYLVRKIHTMCNLIPFFILIGLKNVVSFRKRFHYAF
jgi:hypothetical protein